MGNAASAQHIPRPAPVLAAFGASLQDEFDGSLPRAPALGPRGVGRLV